MRLVTGSCLPMILNVAIELELLEIIVKAGPGAKLSPDDIATQLPTENPQAADMVDRIPPPARRRQRRRQLLCGIRATMGALVQSTGHACLQVPDQERGRRVHGRFLLDGP
ncbi:unnamed protein product [Musa acuminata subsp. burmannicoides]